jgi:iron complex outermembrane receptor protein
VEPAPELPPEPAPVEEPEEVMDLSVGASTPETTESGEEVVTVTGSRIAGSAVQEASHVTVVTQKDIQKTNANTVDEVLRRLPSVSLQGINKQANNGGSGLSTIDLRNMGSGRTLVLINGRRVVSSGDEVVDLNTIPVSMIERIDVLLEGASVIYGSDAVAGVVNIILKDDFEGVQADVFGGISGKGDGEEIGASLTMGTNHDKGNLTVNVQTLIRRPVWQKDRSWARNSVVEGYTNGYNGDDGIDYFYGSGSLPDGRSGGTLFKPDATTGLGFQPWDGGTNPDTAYFFSKSQYISGAQERLQFTLVGDYDLSKHSRAFVEAMYTYRHSQTRLAPQPLSANSTFPNGMRVGVDNPYIPKEFLAGLPAGTSSFPLARRMSELGPRMYDFDVNTGRVVVGLAGELPKYELDWEVYANFGISRGATSINNSLNMARAIESANPSICNTPQMQAKGCVVGDFFGAGDLQPGAVDYMKYTDISSNGFSQVSSGASVSARPVELWAGKLGLAGGLLYRREAGFKTPSGATVTGESGGNGQDPTRGDYSSIEFFGESTLPLLSDLPGAETLEVDLAARFSWYDSFGSKVTWRTSGVWAPIDAFKFRGTYSTAFRNPGISDLYGGSQDSFETLSDPCDHWSVNPDPTVRANCQAQGVSPDYESTSPQIRTNVGGNPKLEAETANVWSAGIVVAPPLPKPAGDFTLSVDYYNVRVKNAITNPEPQYVLDNCYGQPDMANNPNCANVGRGPEGDVTKLRANLQNIGKSETAGIDINANYDFGLGTIGLPSWSHLILGWQGNRLLYFDDTIYGTKVRYYKKISDNAGTYTQWRWLASVTFAAENWSVTSYNRYIGGAKNFNYPYGSIPHDWTPSILYWDLSAQYTVNQFTVTGGIQNVMNKKPPFYMDGDTQSNGNTYDYIGRYFFARLSYKM